MRIELYKGSMADRITASVEKKDRKRINKLVERTNMSQSEIVRQAIRFYEANYEAVSTDSTYALDQYYQMLSSGEHVVLDIDFLHCFLDYVYDSESADDAFLEIADQVSDYHCQEYKDRFDNLGDVLKWLSVCGFLFVRSESKDSYYVTFPSESIRWFMTRFIVRSTADLPFDVEVETGISKAIISEVPASADD